MLVYEYNREYDLTEYEAQPEHERAAVTSDRRSTTLAYTNDG